MEKKNYGKHSIKHVACAILGSCIALVLTGMIATDRAKIVEAKVIETQEKLAEEVFRFHVLANSDSKADQELKLQVRDAVIIYMKERMSETSAKASTVQETKDWAKRHIDEIEELAETVIQKENYTYEVQAEVTTCDFPDKSYGDILFPKGRYEALRIQIGSAKGKNWWCVLYPNLCFVDATNATVSEGGKEDLQKILTDEEYEMVTATSEFKIKWFFFGDETKKTQK